MQPTKDLKERGLDGTNEIRELYDLRENVAIWNELKKSSLEGVHTGIRHRLSEDRSMKSELLRGMGDRGSGRVGCSEVFSKWQTYVRKSRWLYPEKDDLEKRRNSRQIEKVCSIDRRLNTDKQWSAWPGSAIQLGKLNQNTSDNRTIFEREISEQRKIWRPASVSEEIRSRIPPAWSLILQKMKEKKRQSRGEQRKTSFF